MQIFTNANYNFIRWRWHAIVLSLVVIVAGAAVMATRGLPLGVDFSGGTIVVTKFEQSVTEEAVRAAVRDRYQWSYEEVKLARLYAGMLS